MNVRFLTLRFWLIFAVTLQFWGGGVSLWTGNSRNTMTDMCHHITTGFSSPLLLWWKRKYKQWFGYNTLNFNIAFLVGKTYILFSWNKALNIFSPHREKDIFGMCDSKELDQSAKTIMYACLILDLLYAVTVYKRKKKALNRRCDWAGWPGPSLSRALSTYARRRVQYRKYFPRDLQIL